MHFLIAHSIACFKFQLRRVKILYTVLLITTCIIVTVFYRTDLVCLFFVNISILEKLTVKIQQTNMISWDNTYL